MDEPTKTSHWLTQGDAAAYLESQRSAARSLWSRGAITAIVAVSLWFIWHPLGATIALLGLGYLRLFFAHYGDFWSWRLAVAVGVITGIAVALLVRWLQLSAGVGWLGGGWFALLGCLSVGYIGYGTPMNAGVQILSLDRNRSIIGTIAPLVYLVALVALLIVAWATKS